MLDLYDKKYDLETLKQHIYLLRLVDIVKTQTLTSEFIVKYILNPKYQLLPEEEKISIPFILEHQRQLTKNSLFRAMVSVEHEDDSLDDFEVYSNK